MSCECINIPPCATRPSSSEVKLIRLKPYVYEVINGKRKRVSPFVIKDGIITEIKKRAIISIHRS
jgi:hypothetical protein